MSANQNALYVRDCTIAQESMQPGMTYQKLADKFGVSKSLINMVLKKPQIKELVEKAHKNLAAFTPLAVERFLEMIDDPKHSDHYKAVRDQLQTMGILASHTGGNTYIQQIYNQNTLPEEAEVSNYMKFLRKKREDDVIEAEFTADNTNSGVDS